MTDHQRNPTDPPRPLADVRVLEFTHSASGPYAGQQLADWGADVLKVEPPGGAFERDAGRHHHYMGNRGKRSICLDLKTDAGRTVALDLAEDYDVVIENYRQGALRDLGLGYEDFRKRNDRVIYCSITGFGTTGPKRDWPAFDPIAQALSGIMHMTGNGDRKPSRVGASLLDYGSATAACFAIMLAIHQRERTGEGTRVETSLLETGFAWAGTWVVYHSLYGDLPERMGDRIATYAPNGAYETEDALVYVSAFGDTSWRKLCHALDLEELIEDDRFATPAARCDHRDELDAVLEARTREFDAETLRSTLLSANVPCAPIQSPAEAMADAHLRERGMVGTVETEDGDTVRHAGNPVRFGGTSAIEHPRVPDRGEHTTSVLAEELGYDEARIRSLEAEGAVGPAED